MSRSGYSDDLDNWALIKWRGQVASSIRGKRGQKFLKDLLQALDEMPIKELIDGELECEDGVCALGSLGQKRGIDMKELDPEEPEMVGKAFDISSQLAAEVVYENDEGSFKSENPEDRWKRMRAWVESKIIPAVAVRQIR